ncbi:putative membrane protein [Rhizobium sp. BK376]|nr:putative membrane protein [Rhizobium sp. BK376]
MDAHQLTPRYEVSVKAYVVAYISTLSTLGGLDAIWLSGMADRLYRPVMGDMLISDARPVPAIAFYLVYAAGLVFLAVRPGLLSGAWRMAVLFGAVLGFTAYATYDLTNQATLKNWSTILTIADLCWGTFLSAVAAGVGSWISAHIVGGKGLRAP